MALVSSSYIPNVATDTYWSVAQAYEVSGAGYTAGGVELTGTAWSGAIYSCTNPSWAELTVSNARYLVFYDKSIGTGASSYPLIGYIDLEAPQTLSAQPFTLILPSGMLFTILTGSRGPSWLNVLDYGADATGTSDSTTAFTNAIAALPSTGGWVYAPTGAYKISSTLTLHQFQGLRGDGAAVTVLNYYGTGQCVNATNTNTPTGLPTPCGFEGVTIDGANAGTGAVGLQLGNLYSSWSHDLYIRNFHSSGAIGLYFKNYGGSPDAEKLRFLGVTLTNNTTDVVLDTGSFDYSVFEFYTPNTNANQCGVTLQNAAELYGCRLSIRGNYATAATNTGWVLGLDPGNTSGTSSIQNGEFDICVEADGSTVGHKTIMMGSALPNCQISGVGVMVFANTEFQGAAINPGSLFCFSGYVNDPVLGTSSYGDAAMFHGGTQWAIQGGSTNTLVTGQHIYAQFGDVNEYKLPNTSATIAGFGDPFPRARRIELLLHQPASGAHCVVTWPSNVVWANGYSTLSTTNSAVDRILLTYYPGDTTWYAVLTTAPNVVQSGALGTPSSGTLTNCTLPEAAVTGVDNANGTGSVGGIQLLEPLTTTTIYTASTAPTIGQTTLWNASSGNLTPTLPALSGLSVGACLTVGRDPADNSTHTVTLSCSGSDTFYSSGATSASFLRGEQRTFQVISVSGTKHWATAGCNTPVSALDARYLNGQFAPADNGWLAWSADPLLAYTGLIVTGGDAYFIQVPIRQTATISNVILYVATAGASLTSGENFAGLFSATGTLLSATADQTTNWQSTGLKTMALSAAQTVAAGVYYVGFYGNGTTLPKFSYNASTNANFGANSGTYPRIGIDVTNTGLTTAFHSPAAISATTTAYWAAVS